MAVPWPWRRKCIRAGFRSEQQFLKIRSGPLLQSSPLVNGDQHGCLHTPFGHDLGPSAKLVSSNSLKRALASCTCHVLLI